MRHLFWTLALRDREAIYDHVEGDDPSGDRLDGLFAERAELVPIPASDGLAVRGTRELVVHRRYILVWQVDAAVTTPRAAYRGDGP